MSVILKRKDRSDSCILYYMVCALGVRCISFWLVGKGEKAAGGSIPRRVQSEYNDIEYFIIYDKGVR